MNFDPVNGCLTRFVLPKTTMILPILFIAPSPGKGRGVYTTEDIAPGTLVEVSPVIIMSGEERQWLDRTLLHDYIFEWGPDRQQCCMALGYVPVYNHAFRSNCEYEMDFEKENISIRAVQPVQAGEELLINYNGNWDDSKPLWFEAQ
jgi:SET domain-containing protein